VSAKACRNKPDGRTQASSFVWGVVKQRRTLVATGLALMVVNRVAALAAPYCMRFFVDEVLSRGKSAMLFPLLLTVLGTTIVQAGSLHWLNRVTAPAANRAIADLRCRLREHIGRLSLAFYDGHSTGALLTRIMRDTEALRNVMGSGLVEFTGSVLTALLALTVLYTLSPLLTAILFCFMIGFSVYLKIALGKVRRHYHDQRSIEAEVTGRLTESLGGIRVTKVYRAEQREAAAFAVGAKRLFESGLRVQILTSNMSLIASILLGTVMALLMFIGEREIGAGSMTLGGFMTFMMFLGLLASPIAHAVSLGSQFSETMAGLDRARDILSEPPEDSDPRRRMALRDVRGEIQFDRVSFSYQPGTMILREISFRARPGTTTALVGPSGSGKSTIISLIAAFYSPTSGAIRVDGCDVRDVSLSTWRNRLGVVLQDTFLFDGSVADNVAFACPTAARGDILRACHIAGVDRFAEELPQGYETLVGERGVKLSGGQKQRISIARAILSDPKILIFDEATSSLDSESEALIQEGMAWLARGRTCFVIAHRLSTIRRADQILFIENGEIIERGSHASLLSARGRYWELYTKQYDLESNLFLAPGEYAAAADSGSVIELPAREPVVPPLFRPFSNEAGAVTS